MHTPPGFHPAHRLPAAVGPQALVFAFRDGKLVCAVRSGSNDARIPTLEHARALGVEPSLHYMGELDGCPCVATSLAADAPLPPGWEACNLRGLFGELPDALLSLAARAFQVVDFDATHRYCGRCGSPTVARDGERARECPACHLVFYPRVSPAMMVLVTRGGELLLARAARFAEGMYSALAGFVEPGETIEDCIRREVREEVGIEVDHLTYFDSQSWAFPHSLMIAFTARHAGGTLAPDGEEIVDARWFAPDALPRLPNRVSIARRLIDDTAARLIAGRDGAR